MATDPIEMDMIEAHRDLDELIRLSRLYDFDLYEFLRLFDQAGASVYDRKIDGGVTESADRLVFHYQLSEGLKVILVALRTRHLDADKIECGLGHEVVPAVGAAP